jgi:hypothetical protein
MNNRHIKWIALVMVLGIGGLSLRARHLIAESPGATRAGSPQISLPTAEIPEPTTVSSAVVTLSRTSSSTRPKITWSTTSVNIILSPGETTGRDLTFTSSQALQNVQIAAVPKITPFLTIQPSSFSSVPANQEQSVRLTFVIPAGAAFGIYDGTIHLRAGGGTLPKTVKVVVSVWRVLTTCTLSASPSTITQGGSSTLSWTTTGNPTSASIDNDVGTVNPASGSIDVSPSASTTYTLTVMSTAANGSCFVPVTVNTISISQEVVTNGRWIFGYDLAIDSTGIPHIAFQENDQDRLFYTNRTAGVWTTPQVVSITSDVGSPAVSLEVDLTGTVHIAFDSGIGGNDVLTYASNGTGSWATDVVRTFSREYSLALDTANIPRVAYHYDYDGLNYAIKSTSAWTNQNVDSSGMITVYTGRYPQMALDSTNKAHIVYFDYLTQSIRYATNTGSMWNIETIGATNLDPNSTTTSENHAVAIDSRDQIHVSYARGGNILYARRTALGWMEENVAVGKPYRTKIAIDSRGVPYIVYTDDSNTILLLAEKGSEAWRQHSLYTALNPYSLYSPTIQIRQDNMHIAVSQIALSVTLDGQLLYFKNPLLAP